MRGIQLESSSIFRPYMVYEWRHCMCDRNVQLGYTTTHKKIQNLSTWLLAAQYENHVYINHSCRKLWSAALLNILNWEVFHHPPRNPDLALSDFQLFPAMHVKVAGKCFHSNYKLQKATNFSFVHTVLNHWFKNMI